jgi:branched-chain amino acid aminotransferase
MGAMTMKLYKALTGIQYGTQPDPHSWIEKI